MPPGAAFDAYERFETTTLIVGGEQGLPGAFGAQHWLLIGELGWSHATGLPNPAYCAMVARTIMAWRRWPGSRASTARRRKSCAHDGFVTTNAWGWRLRLAASYPDALFGATLTPC